MTRSVRKYDLIRKEKDEFDLNFPGAPFSRRVQSMQFKRRPLTSQIFL
jgi:hypothetical protein